LLQEIHIGFGFTFLVQAHPGSPGQNPESCKMVVVVVVQIRHGRINNYYYYRFMALWILSGTTQVSRHQKGKSNLDLLEQEIVSGGGIS